MINLVKKVPTALLLVLILIGCREKAPNKAILHDTLCPAPCWNNISPGITDIDSALWILESSSLVEQKSLEEALDGYYFARLSDGGGVGITEWNKKVKYIRLYYESGSSVTISELIEVLGEPEFIRATFDLPPHGEAPCYQIDLAYPARGIYANVLCNQPKDESESLGSGVTLDPDSEVAFLGYWEAGKVAPYPDIEGMRYTADPWQGFRYYSIEK